MGYDAYLDGITYRRGTFLLFLDGASGGHTETKCTTSGQRRWDDLSGDLAGVAQNQEVLNQRDCLGLDPSPRKNELQAYPEARRNFLPPGELSFLWQHRLKAVGREKVRPKLISPKRP